MLCCLLLGILSRIVDVILSGVILFHRLSGSQPTVSFLRAPETLKMI